jgi:hypothetical protein
VKNGVGEVLRCAQDFACGLRRPQTGSSSIPSLATIALFGFAGVRGPSLRLRFGQDFACGLRRPQNGSSSIPSLATISFFEIARGSDPSLRESSTQLLAAHAEIQIKNVGLDLIAHAIPRRIGHLQHLENGAGIAVAPFDQRVEDGFEI